MLLKDRVDNILLEWSSRKSMEGANVVPTLNILWPYSQGYIDCVNYSSDAPFIVKFGHVIDAPNMPVEKFARLVNARLVKDKLPYAIEIGMRDSLPQLSFGGILSPAYTLKVLRAEHILMGDEIIETLFI